MSHPSYLQMVKEAIISCDGKSKAISRETIREYVANNYDGLSSGKRFEAAIIKALQQGIDKRLWQYGDKRYKGDNTQYKYMESSDEESEEEAVKKKTKKQARKKRNGKRSRKETEEENDDSDESDEPKKKRRKRQKYKTLECDVCNKNFKMCGKDYKLYEEGVVDVPMCKGCLAKSGCESCSADNNKNNNKKVRYSLCSRCGATLCSVCKAKDGGLCWMCADKYRRRGYKVGNDPDPLIHWPAHGIIGPIKQSKYNKISPVDGFLVDDSHSLTSSDSFNHN